MVKFLRVAFIVMLVICFLVSCRQRRQEVSAVLKNPPRTVSRAPKSTPARSGAGAEHMLREKLGLSQKEVRSHRLYSFVADWYGVPYKYGGCQKSGVDCSCFASLLSEKVYGTELPRRAEDMFKGCKQLEARHAREGDLVFFNIGGRKVNHVGVYLRDRWFVHASTSRGVVLSSLDEAYYKKYFFCAGRVKGS